MGFAGDHVNLYGEIYTGISEDLDKLIENLELGNEVKLHLDLGEIQGFRYHNGVVFSAYTESAGYSLAKGGRYDGLRKLDNEPRPAVGFDLDLLAVASFTKTDI